MAGDGLGLPWGRGSVGEGAGLPLSRAFLTAKLLPELGGRGLLGAAPGLSSRGRASAQVPVLVSLQLLIPPGWVGLPELWVSAGSPGMQWGRGYCWLGWGAGVIVLSGNCGFACNHHSNHSLIQLRLLSTHKCIGRSMS